MKLLLTSEGITNKSIESALFELVEKPFHECRVAYVPTAGYDVPGDKNWIETDMDTVRRLKPFSFDIVDISHAPKSVWFPIFEQSDVLAFGGGSVAYLLEWLEKSGVREALPELLAERAYVGFSAGSMVTAKTVSLSMEELLSYDQTGSLFHREGLGFVDFEIRPHLNASDFPKIRLAFLEKIARIHLEPFYAIDNATAVKVNSDKVSVVSEGKWKKFN